MKKIIFLISLVLLICSFEKRKKYAIKELEQ